MNKFIPTLDNFTVNAVVIIDTIPVAKKVVEKQVENDNSANSQKPAIKEVPKAKHQPKPEAVKPEIKVKTCSKN